MRALCFSLALLVHATAGAYAQNPQTTIDIGVSGLTFDKGVVHATVRRKDPAGQTPIPQVRARVTIAVKGQSPFHTAEVLLKPGASVLVSAPYKGSGSAVVFVATSMPVGIQEIAAADNRRESIRYAITAKPSPNQPPPKPSPNQQPLKPLPNQPAKPSPNKPAPAPPPAPPLGETPAATISTAGLLLIGGEQHAPTAGASTGGVSITTSGFVLIGGAQGTPAVRTSGAVNIVTPPLILIGRMD